MIDPSHRHLPDDTQHSQQTDFHAPGGIRTHNPSQQAAADRRLRPRGVGPLKYYIKYLSCQNLPDILNSTALEEKCPTVIFCTTKLTWTDPGSNLGLRGRKYATTPLRQLKV